MDKSKWPFFYNFYKKRSSTKWGFNLLIAIMFAMLSALLSSQLLTDEKSLDSIEGIDQDLLLLITRMFSTITGAFSTIISILFIFILSLIVTKIFKTEPRVKSLFSGSISLVLIINIVTLIVVIIQFLFGLNPEKYNILSLNIFNPGNEILGAFDFKLIIQSYLFMLLLHATGKLSIKYAAIISIVLFIFLLTLNLIGALI
ncbi:hypothetical protein ACU40P_07355 [Staphylococcus arlettae]|uniref:hypothetical protein n=3 Tax=Staphylococcus arlettae TaxID=29378 RepID=UPI00186B891C|nr:hypothetical protein [Staphylococcus arlettae]QZZ03537.1 hypothetical protein K7H07_12525 [Staphylococcus arlettae]